MMRILPVLSLFACSAPPRSSVSASDGVSLGLFASDSLFDYGELVEEIGGLGADSLLLVVPVHLADSTASVPVSGFLCRPSSGPSGKPAVWVCRSA